jgi:UDP-N-acetylmuramoyl-L-alanyl-D-glutamate--2,6-diaminopimelate ligase
VNQNKGLEIFFRSETVLIGPETKQAIIETIQNFWKYAQSQLKTQFLSAPVMSYDFHLDGDRPKLIEINTSAAGYILTAHSGRYGISPETFSKKITEIFNVETTGLKNMAIVDEKVKEQFFYEEFEIVKNILTSQGFSVFVLEPQQLIEKNNEHYFENQKIHSNLVGKFNVYNWLATWKAVSNFGVSIEQFKKAVEELKEIPGRAQIVKKGDVECVVDYAHTPESLEAIYKAFPNKKKICILGNTGGGRDVWKRPEMAKIADKYCETVILTNEDPYDEDPMKIINDMAVVIPKDKLFVEIDRRKAINTAIKMANKESIVIITGKGTDPYIMGKNGEKTPWDDKTVAEEELNNLKK